jgi:hypothetical protein
MISLKNVMVLFSLVLLIKTVEIDINNIHHGYRVTIIGKVDNNFENEFLVV